jgi:hypothetical protein
VSGTSSKKRDGNQEHRASLTPIQAAFLSGLIDLAKRETGAE